MQVGQVGMKILKIIKVEAQVGKIVNQAIKVAKVMNKIIRMAVILEANQVKIIKEMEIRERYTLEITNLR